VIKVLCQLQHRSLAPSIHSETLNPKIDFSSNRLKVQQYLAPWKTEDALPLRAGVSSFGAAGVNAHLILEEYRVDAKTIRGSQSSAQLFVLSAKTNIDLFNRVSDLLQWIGRKKPDDSLLPNVAYTLQTGRDQLLCRFACRAATFSQLSKRLQVIVNAGVGSIGQSPHVSALKNLSTQKCQSRKLEIMSADWLAGRSVEWQSLHEERRHRVRLPVYPFFGEQYWVRDIEPKQSLVDSKKPKVNNGFKVCRSSDGSLQNLFPITLDPSAFYLSDHLVDGHPVLPGVVHLEISVQAALSEFDIDESESTLITLKDVVWASPVDVNAKKDIGLKRDLKAGNLDIQITDFSQSKLHSQCAVSADVASKIPRLNLSLLKSHVKELTLGKAELYPLYERYLVHYGDGMQAINNLTMGPDTSQRTQVLAHLILPDCVKNTQSV
jgi:acyl transferase domain-containing protein